MVDSLLLIIDESTLVSNIEHYFSYDWVQFHDGIDESAPLLGCGKKWCQFTPPIITSSEHVLLIKFHSDVGYELSGFEFLYEAGEMIYLQYPMLFICRLTISPGFITKVEYFVIICHITPILHYI